MRGSTIQLSSVAGGISAIRVWCAAMLVTAATAAAGAQPGVMFSGNASKFTQPPVARMDTFQATQRVFQPPASFESNSVRFNDATQSTPKFEGINSRFNNAINPNVSKYTAPTAPSANLEGAYVNPNITPAYQGNIGEFMAPATGTGSAVSGPQTQPPDTAG